MNSVSDNLYNIGFGKWVLETVAPESLEQFDLGRVVAVHKDSYIISDGEVDVLAQLVGKIMFGASSPVDYPTVGDWVLANFYDENTFAIIHEILPRKSLLKRKTPGKKINFQLIGSNIDVAFIIQSLNENFNLRRLERYLVMVNDAKIEPILLLSKSDLLDHEAIKGITEEVQTIMPHLQVIPFSNEDKSQLDNIKGIIQAGLTFCLLGSSGVGKTSLINNLTGDSKFTTKPVSKKESKGRHATTHRQMVRLDSGALVVDTPGMREIGNFSVVTGLGETFNEISDLAESCQFNDCTHTNEKGCAVLEALENGQLSVERYQNYIKMIKESAYNEMSYLEKRKKDRRFGKHVKNVMNHKKSQR